MPPKGTKPKTQTRKAAGDAATGEQGKIHYAPPLTYSQAIRQIGTTGVRRVGPYVREEYLRELQGSQGRAKYREMFNNDVVRRAIRAIKLPMLAAHWNVVDGEGPDAEKASEFLRSCQDDMLETWYLYQNDIITWTMVYGSSWYQVLYKQRRGPRHKERALRSKHADGLWGWQDWSPRGQETWEGWQWDEGGRMIALRQSDPYASGGGGFVDIPLDQSLHFRIGGRIGDPNGESMLRAAYVPWYGLKHADDWVGILIERMGGVAHFSVTDENIHLFDSANPDMSELKTYLENAVTAFRIDEQLGVISPSGIDFQLENVPVKIDDLVNYIKLCSWRILGSVLAQFLELGQAPRGSFAKSESDRNFFMLAMQGILSNVVAATINRNEIPRLFALNAGSFRLTELPHFEVTDIVAPELADIAEPLAQLVQAMVVQPGPALEEHVRQIGKLPEEEEVDALGKTIKPEDKPHDEGDEHWTVDDMVKMKTPPDSSGM